MSEIGIDIKAINLSPTTPSREKKGVTAEKTPQKAPSSSSAEDEDGSPIRHIVCVKNKFDVKHFEDVEDCFLLDFDPFEPVQFSKLSVSDNGGGGDSPDIAVVAEKGQVFKWWECPYRVKIGRPKFGGYFCHLNCRD